MQTGKLPIPLLDSLLRRYASKDRNIVIGPGIGVDATVIKFGDRFLVAKTDPITFTPHQRRGAGFTSFELGRYLVNINANDIVCMGGVPEYFLVTLLLPENTKKKDVEKIFSEISITCRTLYISLCGGHTEITSALSKPVAIGAMFGEIKDKNRLSHSRAAQGDEILLVKGIAIEGTSLLAREKEKEIEREFGRAFLERVSGYIKRPGISVIKEAEIAWRYGKIKAMHDPTEQGLSGGLYEIGMRLKTGIVIDMQKIFVLPECEKLCRYFNLNPFGLISSGTLLVVVEKGDGRKLVELYKKRGIQAEIIGHLVRKKGVWFKGKRGIEAFPMFQRDEISKVL